MDGQTALKAKALFDQLDTSAMSSEELQLHGQLKTRLENEPAVAVAMRRQNPPAAQFGDPRAHEDTPLESIFPAAAHPLDAITGFLSNLDPRGLAHPIDAFMNDWNARGAAMDRLRSRGAKLITDDPQSAEPGEDVRNMFEWAVPVLGPAMARAGRQMESTDPTERARGFGGAIAATSGPKIVSKAISAARAPSRILQRRPPPSPPLPEIWNGPEPRGTMPITTETTAPPSLRANLAEYLLREAASKVPGVGTFLADKLKGSIARPRTTSTVIGQMDLGEPAAFGDAPEQPINPFKPREVPATQFEPRDASGKYVPRKSIPLKSDNNIASGAEEAVPSPKPGTFMRWRSKSGQYRTGKLVDVKTDQAGKHTFYFKADHLPRETEPVKVPESAIVRESDTRSPSAPEPAPSLRPAMTVAQRIEQNRQANLAATRTAGQFAAERERTMPVITPRPAPGTSTPAPAPSPPSATTRVSEPSTISTPKGEGVHTHTFTNPHTGESIHRVELKDGTSTVVPAAEPAAEPASVPGERAPGTVMRWKRKSTGEVRTGKLVEVETDQQTGKRIFHIQADHLPKNAAPVAVPEANLIRE